MTLKKFYFLIIVALATQFSNAQEGLPIYSDYLTDNYYLIHPSMAGVANCSKVRLTSRQQWFGHDKAPRLTTLSVNGRVGESPSALGGILFTDRNGYHSQSGAFVTYAHHLMFSRNPVDLNMLSFGLSAGVIQYKLDQSEFFNDGFDPLILPGNANPSATNLNIDVGFSYHFLNFYAHATIKNLLANDGINSNEEGFSYNNLRTFLFSAGNVFNSLGSDWSYEPSVMFMYRESTQQTFMDINAKAYKEMEFGQIWGGLSYRTSFDGAEFQNGPNQGVKSQRLQYITPILGVNYKNFVFAYTYSYQVNSIVFNNGGYHQITLGINFGCRKAKYDCKCPAVN